MLVVNNYLQSYLGYSGSVGLQYTPSPKNIKTARTLFVSLQIRVPRAVF
jgi:hypothetical protein